MSEKLLSRVKRLVSGAVYDRVEALESAMPEATMREAIREIERTIDELREEMAQAQAERHVAGKRIELSNNKIASLAEKIETALLANREDLAHAAIERQMDLEAQIPVLEKTQNEASETVIELGSYIDALRGRMAEMEEELDAYKEEVKLTADADGDISASNNQMKHEKRAEKAERAFDRVMKSAVGVGGMGRSDRATHAKLIELEVMERKNKIAKRLEAHRANLNQDQMKAS